jgi:hypothetical protein
MYPIIIHKRQRPCLLRTPGPMQKEEKLHQIVQQSPPAKQKVLEGQFFFIIHIVCTELNLLELAR